MSEKKDTRRAVVTGGAVLLGAAVVGGAAEGTAEAANGGPLLIGRANVGSAETKLTNASPVPALNVISTNAAHAAVLTAKHKDRWGLLAVNESTGRGVGGAIRADGRQNTGLSAGTSNKAAAAIVARNAGATANDTASTAVVGTVGPTADQELRNASAAYWHSAGGFAGPNGVMGVSTKDNGFGVIGVANRPGTMALVGIAFATSTALHTSGISQLNGPVNVYGTLTKAAGSFRIDHPLDPANKYLSHSFVESPDMLNVYNGNVIADARGEATVELPDWFEALNKDYRYQLTPMGGAAPELHVKSEVSDGRFGIGGAKPGQKISWQLTGIRQDAYAETHRIPVEEEKSAQEKGRYVFPKGFGKPESASVAAHR